MTIFIEIKLILKMFRTISHEPHKKPGKHADKESVYGKAHHYATGEDNEFIGAKSTLADSFVNHGV